jgi:hypothetical protein
MPRCIVLDMSLLGELLIVFLPSLRVGDNPSRCETGTRVLTR